MAAVPITTEDLTNLGLEMQVREGGPSGRLLATKSDAKFPGGIKRRALCGGLRTKFASGEPVAHVTFFLDHVEPSLSGDARSGVSHAACKPESWIPRVPALDDDARRDATVKRVGDLNSDGLPEYEIDYQNAATGWGMTLLSSTGGPDCFVAVYEGSGSISSISKNQTGGWRDLTITYSAIVGDKGRGMVTAAARRVAARYELQQVVHCQTLGGDDVPLSECQGTLEFEGNALSGMPAAADLQPLAKPGQQCAPCSFNGRCALLTNSFSATPCCDYVGGKETSAWQSSGSGDAARCLSLILGAPEAPSPAKGNLQPLARPGQACKSCFFNGRCALLVDGRANASVPCCDYTNGKKAGEWADDEQAPRCLSLNVPPAK